MVVQSQFGNLLFERTPFVAVAENDESMIVPLAFALPPQRRPVRQILFPGSDGPQLQRFSHRQWHAPIGAVCYDSAAKDCETHPGELHFE